MRALLASRKAARVRVRGEQVLGHHWTVSCSVPCRGVAYQSFRSRVPFLANGLVVFLRPLLRPPGLGVVRVVAPSPTSRPFIRFDPNPIRSPPSLFFILA